MVRSGVVVATSIRSGSTGSGVGHGSVWPSIPTTISTIALPTYAPHRQGGGMRRGMVYRWVGTDTRHGGMRTPSLDPRDGWGSVSCHDPDGGLAVSP